MGYMGSWNSEKRMPDKIIKTHAIALKIGVLLCFFSSNFRWGEQIILCDEESSALYEKATNNDRKERNHRIQKIIIMEPYGNWVFA